MTGDLFEQGYSWFVFEYLVIDEKGRELGAAYHGRHKTRDAAVARAAELLHGLTIVEGPIDAQ